MDAEVEKCMYTRNDLRLDCLELQLRASWESSRPPLEADWIRPQISTFSLIFVYSKQRNAKIQNSQFVEIAFLVFLLFSFVLAIKLKNFLYLVNIDAFSTLIMASFLNGC